MTNSGLAVGDAAPSRPNPYPGPRSFRYGERIYGRDREIDQLADVLIAERIVLFYSPSGAGKTSLLEAGLRPRLEQRDFEVLPIVRVGYVPPPSLNGAAVRNRYLLSTLLSLEEDRPSDRQLGISELLDIELSDYLARLDHNQLDPCILFDQFEELFTLDPTDQEQKMEFLHEVGVALRDRGRWALFSMREDFIAQLDPYLHLVPTRFNTRYRLDLLGTSAAETAIREPAEEAGVRFSAAAADRLVDDLRRVRVKRGVAVTEELGPYVEPVQLQVVCRQLWSSVVA
jgi:8-oxo-dGTP pyrophosphatase MutT (NUDIX family)